MRTTPWQWLVVVLVGCAGAATITGPDGGAGDAGQVASLDAGVDAGLADAGAACGGAGTAWECSEDGSLRRRCVGAHLEVESCTRGCLRPPPGTEAQCLAATDTLSCPGSWGTVKSLAGDYDLTAFGCWVDAAGATHPDPGDNCIPTCLDQARSAGVCAPGDTGPQCEERVTWYTADAARFGCLARVRITNPANGKSVVAVALDYGPACSLERGINFPILDASGRVDRYLFGSDQGSSDRALTHVVEVDAATPLGPVP